MNLMPHFSFNTTNNKDKTLKLIKSDELQNTQELFLREAQVLAHLMSPHLKT